MNVTTSTAAPGRVLDEAIAALNRPGATLPLADVDRALRQSPYDARLWHVKGLIHREQDRRELAIPALQRAAELAPAEPLIVHGYARTLLEAGVPCIEEFARAAKVAPENPDVFKGLVSALAAEGRIREAIEGMEQSLDCSPLWTDGHTLLSSLRWSAGERQGFTRSFDEALGRHPNSLDLRREQLLMLLEAEHFDDAIRRVEEGRRMFGDHILFSAYEAATRSESGDLQRADQLFTELAVLKLPNVDVWRVRHLLRSGRPEESSLAMDHWLGSAEQTMFWPYAATAWRMTADPRSDWLEGDERFVGVWDISNKLPRLDGVAATLRKLHVAKSEFFGQSVRGGTQTDGNLFSRIEPEIVAMREAIREAVAAHAAQLPPVAHDHPLLRHRPQSIKFNGAWSVRLVAGGMHANHVHPMGWLSSALYISLPPDLGKDQAGWLKVGEPQAQLGVDVPPHRTIEPKPGRLALFPSWMWHGTTPFGEGERMTVAFDVAPAS